MYTPPRPPVHWHAIGTQTTFYAGDIFVYGSSTAYPTADLAIYCPVPIRERVVVRKLFVSNGSTASGNFDVGIYDAAGTRLVSAGTTAHSGISTEQVVDITDTTLGPGLYYVAVVFDNTTGTLQMSNPGAPIPAACGLLTEQLGAGGALPATATWAMNQTISKIPAIGMLLVTGVS